MRPRFPHHGVVVENWIKRLHEGEGLSIPRETLPSLNIAALPVMNLLMDDHLKFPTMDVQTVACMSENKNLHITRFPDEVLVASVSFPPRPVPCSPASCPGLTSAST